MTDPNYTHITVLIDESGSMGSLADDTRGGFNSFLAEQQLVPGKATMTVCKFSGTYTILHSLTNINDVRPLNHSTYNPLGGTALLDAMGRTITDLGIQLAAMTEEERPGKILFLVITDGQENSSTDYSRDRISGMVKLQEQTYKWNFLYLGANVDAFEESSSMGIRTGNALNFVANSKGTQQVFHTLGNSIGAVRSASAASGKSLELYTSSVNVDEAVAVDYVAVLQNQTVDSVKP